MLTTIPQRLIAWLPVVTLILIAARSVPDLPTNPLTATAQAETTSLEGIISIAWGDSIERSQVVQSYLTDDRGQRTMLLIEDTTHVPIDGALNGKRVIVQGVWLTPIASNEHVPILRVTTITLSSEHNDPLSDSTAFVLGPQPWLSILCKFADVPTEPKPLSFFAHLYANEYPYLDHYWRELSYGAITLAGSNAVGWYTLPKPTSYYYYDNGTGQKMLDLARLAEDCTAVADHDVYFPNYAGINIYYNKQLTGSAYGSASYLTRDNVSRSWRMTWLDAESFGIRLDTVEHEMGHAFGLPHSRAARTGEYGNYWDVMSFGCGWYCQLNFIETGIHTIAWHKRMLGWIPDNQVLNLPQGTSSSITLERLALPRTSNYKMVQVPIDGSSTHFYTLEARQRVGHDWGVRYQAVIIHEIDTTQWAQATVLERAFTDFGGFPLSEQDWIPGQMFRDTQHEISVCVNGATATGMVVTVGNGKTISCSSHPDLSPSAATAYLLSGASPQKYRFTITLTNWGIPANNVVVTATIPQHTHYISD